MADEDRGSNSLLAALAHPTIVNPLAAYQGAAQTANSIWANREWQAKQAAGEAQQGGIDPATGEYSPNRAMQLLSQSGPGAALAAGQTLESSQRLSDQQLAQAQKKTAWVNAAAGAALQSGDYSDGAMLKLFQDGMATGMLTLPEVQKQLAVLPPDAAGRQQWLEQHQMTAASTQQQLDQKYGTTGTVTGPGGRQMGTVQAPARAGGGVSVSPQPGAQLGLTPREGAEPTRIGVTPEGAPVYAPLRSTPFAPPGENGGQMGDGRYPTNPALRHSAAGGQAPPATPPGAPPGGVVTDLAPNQRAAQETTGTQSAGAFQEINKQGVAAQSQGATIDNMLADTTKFVPGPGAEGMKNVQATIQSFTPRIAAAFGIDPQKIAAQESFDKLAAQIQDAQGAGSDARLAVVQAATPSSHLTPAGVDLILRQLRGNADYLVARKTLAASYPDTSDIRGFENMVGKNLDPRAFQYARLAPAQKADYLKSVKDPQTVMKAYDWAQNRGLLGGQ